MNKFIKIFLVVAIISLAVLAISNVASAMCTSPETSNCDDANTVPPISIPPVQNSCPLPSSLSDSTAETVNPGPEKPLQEILDDGGYTQDIDTDQTQIQVWNVDSDSKIVIDAKFIDKYADYTSVFGYYTENDLDTFVPVFKTAEIAGFESVPMSTGGPFTINTGVSDTQLGFAIKTFNGVTSTGNFATKNSLNNSSSDQVVIYNPSSNTFVLGFEDLVGGDNDFNDLVVEIELDCEDVEEEPTTATISATKIVCDAEADLPNWGAGGPDITSTTTSTFLTAHPNCHQANWTFEWAPAGTLNPGDQVGVAGGAWTPFASTASIPTGGLIIVREQFVSGYIPFTGVNDTQNVSAEIYCSVDVGKYDNFDFINPVVAGVTYYCIGFNALISEGPTNTAPMADAGPDQILTLPTNSTSLNGTGTDTDGTIASFVWDFVSGPSTINPNDVEDPAISGLVAGTYVFKLTVTDNDGATDDDTVTITVNPAVVNPQCSDDVDNADAEDALADELDPGCHTDGNPNNTGSYNAGDNDETDTVTQCNDNVDNADAEDTLVDELDPGCHTDGNPSNSSTYNPGDNDEGNSVVTQCNDNVDNADSEDTLVDENDPGCWNDPENSNTYNENDNDEGNSDSDDNDHSNRGSGGGSKRPQCSDKKDNSDPEDTLADKLDPGCHSDGNASNPDSYVKSDKSEQNGEVLGEQTSCGIYVEKYLRVGYNNNVEAVKKVQTFLNNYMKAGLLVDGIYGRHTEAAVSAFQLAHKDKVLTPWGITAPTGIFYLTTQTEVNNIMCPPLNLPIPSNLVNFTPNVI